MELEAKVSARPERVGLETVTYSEQQVTMCEKFAPSTQRTDLARPKGLPPPDPIWVVHLGGDRGARLQMLRSLYAAELHRKGLTLSSKTSWRGAHNVAVASTSWCHSQEEAGTRRLPAHRQGAERSAWSSPSTREACEGQRESDVQREHRRSGGSLLPAPRLDELCSGR